MIAAGPAATPRNVAAPAVELSQASVTFGHGAAAVPALSATTLRIADGEFVALVGPSGCGKSTILRLVGGLVRPTTGAVIVGGREVAAKALRIGMAFQNPTMLPWLTIEQNVMLPLKIVPPFRAEFRRQRRTGFRDKVHALLAQVGLQGFASRYPWQLSGGMLQRANLCRALVHEPRMLLLDEPFGALDHQTRELMQELLAEIWTGDGARKTVLFVTHDIEEAVFLAGRVLVMSARPGRIKLDVPVPLPWPRAYTVKTSPEFVALKARLTEEIRDEVRRASALQEAT